MRSSELGTALALARHFAHQRRDHEAGALLAEVHGWVSEGLDRPDLVEATCSAAALKSEEFQNATSYNKAFYETMFRVKDFWAVCENAGLLQFNQRSASGNDFFVVLYDYLSQFIYENIVESRRNSSRSPGIANQAEQEHAAIITAIGERNGERAFHAARHHMDRTAMRLSDQGTIGLLEA